MKPDTPQRVLHTLEWMLGDAAYQDLPNWNKQPNNNLVISHFKFLHGD